MGYQYKFNYVRVDENKINSYLVDDLNQAIEELSECEEMSHITRAWIERQEVIYREWEIYDIPSGADAAEK
jgi:hypothetical protein